VAVGESQDDKIWNMEQYGWMTDWVLHVKCPRDHEYIIGNHQQRNINILGKCLVTGGDWSLLLH
jgi:hypothetical protein